MKTHKLVLIGNAYSGKSSIVMRLVKNRFVEYLESTIGAAFFCYHLRDDNLEEVKLEIWDTSGSEKYNSIMPLYYRKASVALTVFDLSNKQSFKDVKKWIENVRAVEPECIIYLLANKCDLQPQVAKEDYEQLAYDEQIECITCSAKTGEGLTELVQKMHLKLTEKPHLQIVREVISQPEHEVKGYCCR
jgi:Ras-related protein Rab-5C